MKTCYVIPKKNNKGYYMAFNKIACLKCSENGHPVIRIVNDNGSYMDQLWRDKFRVTYNQFVDDFTGREMWIIVSKEQANDYIKRVIKNAKQQTI